MHVSDVSDDVASTQAGYGEPQALAGRQIEGRPERSPIDRVATIVNTVDDKYFQTAGVGILEGRGITELDRSD